MIVERDAVRAILLTPACEVLLMRIRPPQGGADFWIAPGGGLEPGETVESGMRRELMEEVGLDQVDIGPLLWRRQHTFNWAGKRFCQRERYFVVPVPRFVPQMSDALEAQVLQEFRWWTPADMQVASERMTPLSLAAIVERFVLVGAPIEPPDWEVLVD